MCEGLAGGHRISVQSAVPAGPVARETDGGEAGGAPEMTIKGSCPMLRLAHPGGGWPS
ncbi:hypothetical protein GCM10010521_63600 [Streptomyces rameus]|uniref:Uncharacterized protein n=1 Tax=Streptomyces rameus TaxID=68261 RepID=A0ABP6HI03_9ACTN